MMEMPEGWKRLIEAKSPLKDTFQYDVNRSLYLMAEMAEALDDLTDHTESIETRNAPDEYWQASNRAMKVFQKWKEWK